MSKQLLVLLNTRLRAVLAVALTGSLMYAHAHALLCRQSPFTWVGGGTVPSWLSITLTVALYGTTLLMAIVLTLLPFRKDEKAVAAGLVWSVAILPVAALLPTTAQAVRCLQLALNLVALLAAITILLGNFRLRSA
jgi:hypothetical protein